MDVALVFKGKRFRYAYRGPAGTPPLSAVKVLVGMAKPLGDVFQDRINPIIEMDAEFKAALDAQRSTLPYWQSALALDTIDGIPLVTVS